jgi:inhibitor of KinA sporulation pathway (predicted exonuclease)
MRLDRVLVIDIEATCWDGAPPPGETHDIIEIGVCALDVASCQVEPPQSILVKPQRSQVSQYCTDLTTLTQAQVDAGVAFAAACQRLRKEFHSRGVAWASWGDYDRKIFEEQCAALKVPYPFGKRHLNIKTIYALMHGLTEEPGMADALTHARLPLVGTHHRGGDDAFNIARLLAGMLAQFRQGNEILK